MNKKKKMKYAIQIYVVKKWIFKSKQKRKKLYRMNEKMLVVEKPWAIFRMHR